MQKENFWSKSKKVHTHFTVFCPFFSSNGHWPSAETFNGTFYAVLQNLFTAEKKEEEEEKLLLRFIFTIWIGNECACCCCCCCCSFSSYRFVVCILSTSDSNFFFFLLFYSTNIQVWNKKEAVLNFPSFENECRNDFLFLDPHTKK